MEQHLPSSVERVFYHELGHYVAKQINFLNSVGTGVRQIWIRRDHGTFNEYSGGVESILPKDYVPGKPPPLERLSVTLASLMYGCFFQSSRDHISLSDCFKKFAPCDGTLRHNSLKAYGLHGETPSFAEVENEYFERLQREHLLEPFLHLKPNHLLIQVGHEEFEADLNLLSKQAEPLILSHITVYQSLIDGYDRLIASFTEPS